LKAFKGLNDKLSTSSSRKPPVHHFVLKNIFYRTTSHVAHTNKVARPGCTVFYTDTVKVHHRMPSSASSNSLPENAYLASEVRLPMRYPIKRSSSSYCNCSRENGRGGTTLFFEIIITQVKVVSIIKAPITIPIASGRLMHHWSASKHLVLLKVPLCGCGVSPRTWHIMG